MNASRDRPTKTPLYVEKEVERIIGGGSRRVVVRDEWWGVSKFHKIRSPKRDFFFPLFKFIFRFYLKGLRIVVLFPSVGRECLHCSFRRTYSYLKKKRDKKKSATFSSSAKINWTTFEQSGANTFDRNQQR